jgi:two-component system, LytTR family, response regulator AlgR
LTPLRVLLVDDEVLARSRMRHLLAECTQPSATVVAEAGNAAQALERLLHQPCDVVCLDIHMPGVDGLTLAQQIRQLPHNPALIFITAHAEHAVQAFELEAQDYLTKPVRRERLQAALLKAQRHIQDPVRIMAPPRPEEWIVVHDRHGTERVPLSDVLYFKAELKYLTVRTAQRSYIIDGALNELEQQFGAHYLRIHRNALVARHAIRALQRYDDAPEGEVWAIRLHEVEDHLVVSRRQLSTVRDLIGRK